MEALRNLSPEAQAAMGVLLVVQMVLVFFGLRDLIRRPEEQLAGGRKWPWALLIVLGQTIGPIIYFAVARMPHALEDASGSQAGPRAEGRASAAADLLYGDRDAGGGEDEPK